jgi:hypothetical protein
MSNRLLWFLVLVVIFGLGFFYYKYIYEPNNELPIISEGTQKPIELVQVETLPELNEIFEQQEEISSEENNVIEGQTNTWNSADKIADLRENLASYKTITIENKKFVFRKLDNNLGLYLNNRLVSTFDLVPENLLSIQKIYSSNNEYFISIWERKYIYNENSDTLTNFELNIPINYIKRAWIDYLINTQKWTFLYRKSTQEFEYIDIFEDFIYYKDWYVGILRNTNTRRLNNLWFTLSKNNAIVYYNPSSVSKEKKILYETNLNLTKIYLKGNEIYFEESGDGVYKLDNF